LEISRTETTASATKLTRVNDQAVRCVLEAAGLEFIARLRYIAGSAWSAKCYMNMRPLYQPQVTQTEASPNQMCERFSDTDPAQSGPPSCGDR
jgi:hypothetical protein